MCIPEIVSVWFQNNRKMVNTIWFRVEIIRSHLLSERLRLSDSKCWTQTTMRKLLFRKIMQSSQANVLQSTQESTAVFTCKYWCKNILLKKLHVQNQLVRYWHCFFRNINYHHINNLFWLFLFAVSIFFLIRLRFFSLFTSYHFSYLAWNRITS